jgi:hypothetical protein
MIRNRQIQPEEPQDRTDQALGLAQRQPEHRPERQGCPDCQGRITRLVARCSARLGPPGGNRLVREPDREASALAQGDIVLGTVCHSVPLLGDTVTASGIGFERHGRYPRSGGHSLPMPSRSRHQPADPCNTAPDDAARTRDMVSLPRFLVLVLVLVLVLEAILHPAWHQQHGSVSQRTTA